MVTTTSRVMCDIRDDVLANRFFATSKVTPGQPDPFKPALQNGWRAVIPGWENEDQSLRPSQIFDMCGDVIDHRSALAKISLTLLAAQDRLEIFGIKISCAHRMTGA